MKVLNVLLAGGGPDVAFRAYLLTAVRRLHVDKVRSTQRATPTDDLTPYDRGVPFTDTAVAGLRGRRRGQGLRLAARALAARALAPRGREPEAGRDRAPARHERQLGLRPRLPGPRGTAPGLPDDAHRRPRRRRLPRDPRDCWAATSAVASRAATPRRVRGAPRPVPPVHLDLPRARGGQLLALGAARTGRPRRRLGGLPRWRRRRRARRQQRLGRTDLGCSTAARTSCWPARPPRWPPRAWSA